MKALKTVKVLSLLIGLVMLVSVFAACGASQKPADTGTTAAAEQTKQETTAAQPAEKEKFKIFGWYGGTDKDITDKAVENALKKVPNIEVEIEPRNDSDKIKTYFATGEVPEMYETWAEIVDIAIEMNAIQNLDELIKTSNIPNLYTADAMEKLKYKDHIYTIRNDGGAYVLLYYNKALFAKYGVKPPESVEELTEAVKTFKKNNIIPLALFAKEAWPGRQLFDSVLTRKHGEGLVSLIPAIGEPTTTIDDPRYAETAKTVRDLVKAGLLSEGAFSTNYDKAFELFANGQAAMFQNGVWDLTHVSDTLKENAGVLWYPYADKETTANAKYNLSGGFEPGKGHALKPNATKAQTDFYFAMVEELAKLHVTMRGDVSTPIDLVKYPEIKFEKELTEVQKEVLDVIGKAKSESSMTFQKGTTQVVEEAIQGLLTGGVSPEDFIKKIKSGFEELK